MKTSVVLALDTRQPKKDGTFPIVLRISHFGKISQINTGFYVLPTDWDEPTRTINRSYKGTQSVTRLNNLLQKKKSEAIDEIAKLDERKTLNSFTAVQLKHHLEKKHDTNSFFTYAEQIITDLKKANRHGTARAHKDAIAALKKFIGGKDLTFHQLNIDFLNRFEAQHLKKGKTYNGLAAYLRSIRAIYNSAIKAKLVDKELYPFSEYTIKTAKTRKRAIRLELIQRIENLELKPDHPLYNTRNYFLTSFYLRGMPFADLAHLQLANIVDGRIVYDRQKTGTPYTVKIIPALQTILDSYVQGKSREAFIFPIIKREAVEDQYKDVMWARSRFNKKLKKIATVCDIQENLTSYVSRHSFATRANNLGIPTSSISDMLGHQDIKTTKIYLDSLPNDLLDDYHEKVVK